MRKLIALSLVILLTFCGTAVAESVIDLSTMSLEELAELHKLIDAEIDARIGCEPSAITEGVFEGGVHIKPGTYMITCTDVNSGWGIYIDLFESMESYKTYNANTSDNAALRIFRANFNIGGTAMVNIEEGTVLYIHNGIGTIQEVKSDWIP